MNYDSSMNEPSPPTAAWAIVFACVLAGGVALSALILAAIFGLGAVIAALLY